MRSKFRNLLHKAWFKQLATLFVVVGVIWGGVLSAKWITAELETKLALNIPVVIATTPASTDTADPAGSVQAPEAVKKEIAKSPPKQTSSGKITGLTTSNSDGSKTTTVSSEGNASQTDYDAAFAKCPSSSSPSQMNISDDTGKHPELAGVLRDYLTNQLRTSSEVSSLCVIIIRNAGDTGWSGQYNSVYSIKANGDIDSAKGFIILNTYYYESETNFQDYMKWTLSHEYGHHYTLYHRWVDYDIPAGQRFPDEYYATRPLSKDTTAIDYSKGWENCDAEILAEDYSYFYSGYGIQQMNNYYGLALPSAATKAWIYNLATGPVHQAAPAAAVDNLPTVSITGPAAGVMSGSFSATATASDDIGVSKVAFYVDTKLVSEDTTVPYEATIQTGGYSNGDHILRAIAYDSTNQSAESSLTLTFQNTMKVSFVSPAGNPYDWPSSDLLLYAKTDLGDVVKMELYVNGQLAATENHNSIRRLWPYTQGDLGAYTLTARGYDKDGNYVEASITINKK